MLVLVDVEGAAVFVENVETCCWSPGIVVPLFA